MTDEQPASELALQIADRITPDWESVSAANPNLDGMRLIHEIANGFDTTSKPEPVQPILFSWRHLQIRDEIGRGAFGRVYRAWDSMLKRDVALKLADAESQHAAGPEMVIAEARCLARVRHPNILAVHGAESEDGQVGIWSDLLKGRTLEALLEERRQLPTATVIDLAVPLADALALIHQRALVHGDVKPANIMIQDDAAPVLMDFGAAREQGRPGAAALGSPRFMAPEQLNGAAPSPAGDLFALAVVLYQCLTGHFPWPASSLAELEAAYDSQAMPDLSRVPRGFRKMFGELLSPDPALRPSARQTADRLAFLRNAPRRVRRRAAIGTIIGSLVIGLTVALTAFRAEQKTRLEVQALRDLTIKALQQADPERTSGPTSIKVIYDTLAQDMDSMLADYPAALADMRLIVGRGQKRLGETEAAMATYQRVLDETPRGVKGLARRRCLAMLGLASTGAEMPDTDRAEAAIRAALDTGGECPKALTPAQHLTARNQLIKVLDGQGRWREMLAAQIALLADRERLHGEDSLPTAVDHHNLAIVYQRLGQLDQALKHGTRAGEILESNGGSRSLRLGYVKLTVAGIRNDMDAFDAAQESLDQARELYASNLPPEHRALVRVASEQARLWRRAGQSEKSEALFTAHLSITEPESLPILQKAQRNLAYLLMDKGEWAQANRLLAELRTTMADRLSPLGCYFLAAETFTAARTGQVTNGAAVRAIDQALAEFDQQSLGGIEPYRHLSQWRESLLAEDI